MKVVFQMEVATKPQRSGIDGIIVQTPVVEVAHLIAKGMWVVALPNDDFREVEGVYLDASKPDAPVHVWLEFDEWAKFANLKRCGWKKEISNARLVQKIRKAVVA